MIDVDIPPAIPPEVSFEALTGIATRRERTASRRLARAWNLSEDEALRRTLAPAAGAAGLAAFVAARGARQAAATTAAQAAATARQAARSAARTAAAARHGPANGGGGDGWCAWFDGSARPNPGRCGIGALLRGPGGIAVDIARPAGHGDSSDAEYLALIAVLDAALAHGAAGLHVYGDSRVVIDDVNGPAERGAPALAPYRDHVRAQLAQLPGAALHWVPRHRNAQADALSQQAFGHPDADVAANRL
jgi:ribonuclease HI